MIAATLVRLKVGGGRPPQGHEVLLVQADGAATYLTGLPWPGQAPFDEIGAYRGRLDHDALARLADCARQVAAGPPGADGPADAGYESVGAGGAEASWSPKARPPGADTLVELARAAIAEVRKSPWATAHASLVRETDGALVVRVVNRGDDPLETEGVELRAGWGWASRPPSPLRLAESPSVPLALPPVLEPRLPAEAPLPPPGEKQDEEYDGLYALVRLRWRCPVEAEADWLDGWIVAGPAPV